MKNSVVILLLISVLNFSCRGANLPLELPSHDEPSDFDSKLLVVSHVLAQHPDQSCSQSVEGQTFHTVLSLGDGSSDDIISDDVMTDSEGYLLSMFTLPGIGELSATASLKLCPGSRYSTDESESRCLEVKIDGSDSYMIFAAMLPDDKKLTEQIINVRWCLGSNSASVIKSYDSEISSGAITGRINGHTKAIMEKHSNASKKGKGEEEIGGNDNSESNNDIIVVSRRRRATDFSRATNFRRPFSSTGGRTSNRVIEIPEDQIFVSRNGEGKRMWGDSGEAWLKRNSDKRMWGDSGEAWLKRNSDKRMWGDSGEAWLKRNSNDKRMWGDSGEAWLKRNSEDDALSNAWSEGHQIGRIHDKMGTNVPSEFDPKEDGKRVWGDDGMAWVK